MNKIFMRYGTYNDDEITWEDPVEFHPPVFINLLLTERITGNDLRSINYSHLKSARAKSYKCVISANDLSIGTKLDYFKAMLTANIVQYNLTDENWTTAAVTFTFDFNGIVPFSYINDHKQLPKLEFNIIQKFPD